MNTILSSKTGKNSVCMASYNGEAFIVEQLNSILSEIGTDDEIIIALLLFQILKLRFFTLLGSMTMVGLSLFLVSSIDLRKVVGERMFGVIDKLNFEGLETLFYQDASINARLEHVVFSFDGLVRNYFLPGGFNTYGNLRSLQQAEYNGFFWTEETTDKIMSYYGSIGYEFGIVGVLIVLLVSKAIIGKRTLVTVFECGTFTVFALSAIPVAFAPLYLVIASLTFKNGYSRSKSKLKTHSQLSAISKSN